MTPTNQLRRNYANRRIGGVAAGLSDFLGMDVTLIRVLFVLGCFFTGGAMAAIYVLMWMLIPVDRSKSAAPGAAPVRRPVWWLIIMAAIVIGVVSSINDRATLIVAAIALIAGLIIWRKIRGNRSWKSRKEFQKARLAWQRRLDEQVQQAGSPTYLGGDPFHINSFYPPTPEDKDNPNSGFQIQ